MTTSHRVTVVDILSPGFAERQCFVKYDWLVHGFLIQANDNKELLWALYTIRPRDNDSEQAIVFRAGHMNFHSTGGGHQVLATWRRWLTENGIPMPALRFAPAALYDVVLEHRTVSVDDLPARGDAYVEAAFQRWVAGNADWTSPRARA